MFLNPSSDQDLLTSPETQLSPCCTGNDSRPSLASSCTQGPTRKSYQQILGELLLFSSIDPPILKDCLYQTAGVRQKLTCSVH